MKRANVLFACASVALLIACERYAKQGAPAEMDEIMPEAEPEPSVMPAAAPPAGGEGRAGRPMRKRRALMMAAKSAEADMSVGGIMEEAKEEAPKADEADGDGGGAAATRSWFPETFLFEPLVPTDARGEATVAVTVPDRLTTWRVLALAHSREGSQAGALTSFLGTLPTYVDPVVPAFLMVGDLVELPVQVVNTTDQKVSRTLRVTVSGAAEAAFSSAVELAPRGSKLVSVPVRANRPGEVKLEARLGDKDAVARSFVVAPSGRPMSLDRGGTLAAPRVIAFDLPEDVETDGTKVRLAVYPGALSILRSELSVADGRGGLADDAYALLLAGRATKLLTSLGGEVDADALRKLRIVSSQRVLRHARSADVATAMVLVEAAMAHPDQPVIARLADRLADQLARMQRPDGTFLGGNGWPLQRLLVATAEALRALRAGGEDPKSRQRATGATLRANGAFERNLARIEDAYTAAIVVASGGVEGTIKETLQKKIRDALTKGKDGTKELVPERGVVRGDGSTPSVTEATALAVLALVDDAEAKADLPDLGAALLARYRPGTGWGDGRSNLWALRAVLELFKEPLPAEVSITLANSDGTTLTEGKLSGARIKDVLILETDLAGAKGPQSLRLSAVPNVPGLGYALEVGYYVPWQEDGNARGLELTVDVAKKAEVGRAVDVTMQAVAPGGMAFSIRHALPAGVQPETQSLETLVSDGVLSSFEVEDGAVTMEVPALPPGRTFAARYRVIPTLRGTLHTTASMITPAGRPGDVVIIPPAVWRVE